MNLRQSVVFAILMQGNQGILTKHPSYVAEKLKSCELMSEPERLLDMSNLALFETWKREMHMDFTAFTE